GGDPDFVDGLGVLFEVLDGAAVLVDRQLEIDDRHDANRVGQHVRFAAGEVGKGADVRVIAASDELAARFQVGNLATQVPQRSDGRQGGAKRWTGGHYAW